MMEYNVGDEVVARVTGIEKYGIFVKFENGYTGLIHISEISEKFVKNIYEFAGLDDEIYVKIVDVDREKKRLNLSIKQLDRKKDYIVSRRKIVETKDGFNPLKDHLDVWIKDKLAEIDSENEKKWKKSKKFKKSVDNSLLKWYINIRQSKKVNFDLGD